MRFRTVGDKGWVFTKCLWLAIAACGWVAATCAIAAELAQKSGPAPVIIEKGPHHRVWSQTAQEQLPNGKVVSKTHSYTELASGMHRVDPISGEFVEASDQITLADAAAQKNGFGAVASQTAHQVGFAADIASAGSITLTAPDQKRFRMHFSGIVLWDTATGDTVLFPVRSSIGELSGNSVTYRSCVEGLEVDVVYVNTLAGLSQSLIFRKQPDFSLADLKMNEASTRLLAYSAVDEAPEPEKQINQIDEGGLILENESLDFGSVQIGKGVAFSIDGTVPGELEVVKTWTTGADGSRYLIESVSFADAKPHLDALPVAQQQAAIRKTPEVLRAKVEPIRKGPEGRVELAALSTRALGKMGGLLPAAPPARKANRPMQTAQVRTTRGPGWLLDWEALSGITNGMRFIAGTTYYVSGGLYLSYTNYLEGCVIKFAPTNSAKLYVPGVLVCLTTPTTPAILTARDDISVGEAVGTNTTVSGYYADTGIDFVDTSPSSLSNVRISYAQKALNYGSYSGSAIDCTHLQIVHCNVGFSATTANVNLHNVLMYDVQTNFYNLSYPSNFRIEHLTVDASGVLAKGQYYPPNLYLTNTLLVACTNVGSGYLTNSSSSVTVVSDPSTVFQTVGGGSHYLLPSYQPIAGANISSSLSNDFRNASVRAPVLLTNTIANPTILRPIAERMADNLMCGYAYPLALDFVTGGILVSNSLTIKAGTGIGTFGVGNYALYLSAGADLACEGEPTNLIRIVRYNIVQEQATTNWYSTPATSVGTAYGSVSPVPKARFRFTEWSLPAGTGSHLEGLFGNSASLFLRDSQFHCGRIFSAQPNLYVTNCLFEGSTVELNDVDHVFDAVFRNCLFYRGTNHLEHWDVGVWKFRDDQFDKTQILSSGMDGNYNAYVTGSDRLSPNGTNDLVTNAVSYATGSLSRFYQPTGSWLLDRGSTNAGAVGMYWYSSITNSSLSESNTIVDIGFHLPSTLDYDSDGLPNYREDFNGNGFADSAVGESNYGVSDTDGDGISDLIETLLGRNPLVSGTTNDVSGTLNLRIFTPLR